MHELTYTLSLSLAFFFFLCASSSLCPWLYDREKCVYKTHSLTDQTVRTNQRLWREERETEKKHVTRKREREGVKERVCRGLIISKFSVLFSLFLFFPCSSCRVGALMSACISFGNTISLRPPKQLRVSQLNMR